MALSAPETALLARVQTLAAALRARGWRLATAESCTGGLVAAACTELAGSSDWFESGWVTYSNAAKTQCLAVPATLIERVGAVSEDVAQAMARGALAAAGVQLALAVTGIAGPGGGSAAKPVGTVWVALAWQPAPTSAVDSAAHCLQLQGDRTAIRAQTVAWGLDWLVHAAQHGHGRRP